MTTTDSIDMVGSPSGAVAATSLGEAASCRLSEASASTASGGTPLPRDAASLFQKALAEQTSENAALDETMRTALVSVSETLTAVDAAAAEGQSTTVDAADAEGQTTTVNAADAEGQTTTVNAAAGRDRGSDVLVASAEISEKTADSAASQLPDLPQQIASNATLAAELTAATALVGETLAQVDAERPATVDAAAGRERGSDFQVASAETPETSEVVDIPEPTADALVAAGVAPQVTVPVASGETPLPQTVAAVDAVASAAATPSADVLVQAASAVADTLLVSPGLLRGQGEVLVQLRPDVLDGTEVKISVIGRQLEVVFQPQTVDMAVMIENCRPQLTQHLATKIASFNVSVDVRKKRS